MNSAVCSTEIDMHQLIAEVKKRPLLWNVTMPEYSDKNAKISAWREISQVFMPSYDTEEPARKQEVCRTLQRKWKSLRDSFARELKLQEKESKSGCESSFRKKYVFFEYLSFLRPTVGSRMSKSKLKDITDYQEEEITEKDETKATEIEGNDFEFTQIESQSNNFIPKKRKVSNKRRETEMKSAEIEVLNNICKQLNEKKDEEVLLNEMCDEDRLFLLSLVADLKRVPDENKLDAKTEILIVLKKWQRSSQNNVDQNYYSFEQQPQSTSVKKECSNPKDEPSRHFKIFTTHRSSTVEPTQSDIIADISEDSSYS